MNCLYRAHHHILCILYGNLFSPPPATSTNQYTAVKSEWLFLLNGYLDLGSWHGVTPFVGAGVGFDRLTIGNFTDFSVQNGAIGFSADNSKWNFAWALHAGIAYQVSPNFTVEFGTAP